jgi:predicted ester cyclase
MTVNENVDESMLTDARREQRGDPPRCDSAPAVRDPPEPGGVCAARRPLLASVVSASEEETMAETTIVPVLEVARDFFDACDTGKGWEVCQQYCTPDATFSAQAEPLADVHTLQQYADWMTGLVALLPDGRYAVKAFAADKERNNVIAYGVFSGTHTGEGGPVPPTGKSTNADYVYVMDFQGDRIRHMTKIWNAGFTLQQLGWA